MSTSTEAAALFQALQLLTQQVQAIAERSHGEGSGRGKWDYLDRYKNLNVFDGNSKDFEEWSVKFRSLVNAGDVKVGQLLRAVELECSEEALSKNDFDQLQPEFDESDREFITESSAGMFNLLLNTTTGEANSTVRRSLGSGWLAWKRLTSSLNPRTLASGIKAISAVLAPPRVSQASKADQTLDEWEDKLVKLGTEYGQELTAKVKVAVLYGMMPKDLQEKVLDACAVNWDETTESEAKQLYTKIKAQLRNIAKARREMAGPKPMEVDHVAAWGEWPGGWSGECGDQVETEEDHYDEKGGDEAHVQYIGKGGGKKGGKGFQGYCYTCGEFGHSQWDCHKGKGKGKGFGKDGGYSKGYGKDGYYSKGYGKEKGYGKDGYVGKGYGKDGYYGKGKGGDGKGGMQRACFGCGSTDHFLRDCPKNSNVQQVEEDTTEILFIGNVQNKGAQEGWRKTPMKVTLGDFMKDEPKVRSANTKSGQKTASKHGFKVLEVDDEDEEVEVVNVRMVENGEESAREMSSVHAQASMSEVGHACKPCCGNAGMAGVRVMPTACSCNPKTGSKPLCSVSTRSCRGTRGLPHRTLDEVHGQVHVVNAVSKGDAWASLGVGDIIVDSVADESCWPVVRGMRARRRRAGGRCC